MNSPLHNSNGLNVSKSVMREWHKAELFFLSFFFFLIWGDTRSLRMPALRPASQAGPMRNPREGTSVARHHQANLTVCVVCSCCATSLYTPCPEKKSHWFFCCNFYKYWRIFIFFAHNFAKECQSHWRKNFLPHIRYVATIPCKSLRHKSNTFHTNIVGWHYAIFV